MAGIGLTLRKLVSDQTYLHGAAAYFSSGVISAGPWLISMVSLALLQGKVVAFLPAEDHLLLFTTITYAFVASSIMTGPIQIVLTRVIADQIFLREMDAIVPTFTRTLIHSLIPLTWVVCPFVIFAPFDLSYRLLAASLFLTISLLWLVLAVISAAQDYLSLVLAFVIGYGVSGGAALWLGQLYGLMGALAGFNLGQVVCVALLSQRIFIEFPERRGVEIHLDEYWREYWSLACIGFFYSLGLWAEKFYYWFSPDSTIIHGFYRIFPTYDSAILLAYLMTIPASAVFMVNLETDFYQHYRAFYMQILRKSGLDGGNRAPKGTLDQITQARLSMMNAVRSGFWTLLKVQGMIAVFAILLAPELAQLLGLAADQLGTLRVAILAASGQEFVLYAMLMLLYLDARHQTLILVFMFAVSNIGLTILFGRWIPEVYGLGYLSSTIFAALFGLRQLNARLSKLDYLTFMLQPLEAREKPHALKTLQR